MVGRLLLFLWFIGIFTLTVAFVVPNDITPIAHVAGVGNNHLVNENPFFVYVNFAEPMLQEGRHCLCYFGYDAPDKDKLKQKLTSKEINDYDNTIRTSSEKLPTSSCPVTDMKSTVDNLHINDKKPEGNESKKWDYLHSGYGMNKIGMQMICVSAERYVNETGNLTVAYYDVSVETTGYGNDKPAQIAKIRRLEDEGFLRLEFNTRMAVLQPFGDTHNTGNEYFVIPQIATIQGFKSGDTSSQILIEQAFIEFGRIYPPYRGGQPQNVFHYSKSELEACMFIRPPPLAKPYIGSWFIDRNHKNPTYGVGLDDVDHSKAEEILYQEMLYHIAQKQQQ